MNTKCISKRILALCISLAFYVIFSMQLSLSSVISKKNVYKYIKSINIIILAIYNNQKKRYRCGYTYSSILHDSFGFIK